MNCHKNLSLKLVRKLCRVQPLNGVYRYRDGHYGLYFRYIPRLGVEPGIVSTPKRGI